MRPSKKIRMNNHKYCKQSFFTKIQKIKFSDKLATLIIINMLQPIGESFLLGC